MKRIFSLSLIFAVGMLIFGSTDAISQEQFPMDPQAGYAMRKRPALPSVSRGLPSNPRVGAHEITKCQPPMPPGPPPMLMPMPCCPPPVCATPAGIEPSAYLGYLYKDRGAGFSVQYSDGNRTQSSFRSTRNDFDLQGIWLELAFPVTISKELTATLSGAHLFSLQPKSNQSYMLVGMPSAARWWNPDVYWWEVDGKGAYKLNQYLSAVVGFRWTSLGADFGTPYDERGFVIPNTDTETLRTNTYIPYSGVMLENGADCQGGLKIAAYGSPVVPADFNYRETMTFNGATALTLNPQINLGMGYFVEGYSEYWMKRQAAIFGGFVKFTAVHAERTVGFNAGNANIPIDVTIDRKNWIFGGKIGYVF